jgi:hypothetical protein
MIDLVIFRVPYEDGEATFVEIQLTLTDGIPSTTGYKSGIVPGDSYGELTTDQLVFAKRVDGGSQVVRSISYLHNGVPFPIHDLGYEDLAALVADVLKNTNEEWDV